MPIQAPNLAFEWLVHGFGERETVIPEGITTVKQIHSSIVIDAEGRDGVSCGEGDALVSGQSGITVGVKTADCVPILIADETNRAVAAIHAGWRGTAGNIVEAAVASLVDRFGSKPKNLHAAIGPSIGGCCYQVSADVAHRFGTWVQEWAEVDTTISIDLPRVNSIQLENCGVESVWMAGLCTRCSAERFWSFRRDGELAGRMISFIGR